MTLPVPPEDPRPPDGLPELAHDDQWQRLDPRMLLVHPVREVIRFLPALVGVVVAGAASLGGPWQLLAVAVPVGLGLLRYLTTSFRVHAGRIELRRGLLNRHVLSTPLDRVRTVDLTASPIHRVLGLTTVVVGTGTASTRGDDRLDLDALPTARARALRAELLQAAPDVGPDATPTGAPMSPGADVPTTTHDAPAVRFTPAWLRFAPFTSTGLVIAVAVLGLGAQLGDDLDLGRRLDPGDVVGGGGHPVVWIAVVLALGVLVAVSLLAVLGYLVANWGFTLTRTRSATGGAWHVRRGLLTIRETTLDVERVAGVTVGEPLALRVAGGRRLAAIATGLSGEKQSAALVPPAPRAVVERAAIAVLDVAGPVTGALRSHGPQAVRRRWTRALVPALALAAAAVVAVAIGAPSWLLVVLVVVPLAAGLALDRSRGLGHDLVDGYLVARSGSIVRHRAALAVGDVIGWNLRSTWFQRRVGLTTLVATTAGGSQTVVVPDVLETVAVALACRAQPGLVDQFTERG